MDRKKYVELCKVRALEYLDKGDLDLAVASMIGDMNQRDDTAVAPILSQVAMIHLISHNARGIRNFIEGFN